jgi:hypothetical protein
LDVATKLTAALNLESPAGSPGSSLILAGAKATVAGEEHTEALSASVVVYRKLGSTILRKGVRRDLSRIATRNGYEIAILVRGSFQLRTNDGFRENLKPGATINCKLIATHTYFAVPAQEAELLWIG